MDLERVQREVGQFGRYQFLIFILLAFIGMFTSFFTLSFAFTAADLNYRCLVPQCESVQTAKYWTPWIDEAIISRTNGNFEKCSMYLLLNESSSAGNCSGSFETSRTVGCDRFVFETNEVTIAREFNLLCKDNLWKLAFVGNVNNIGQLIGMSIFGSLSDKFGRKTILLTSVLLSTMMGILRSFSPSYGWMLAFELLDAIVSSGSYGAIFILGIEIIEQKKRVLAGIYLACCYTIAEVIMGVVAIYVTNWRMYLRVLYLPGLLFISYIWLLPESLRWLMANGKYKKAYKILKNISKHNRRPLSEETKAKFHALITQITDKKAMDGVAVDKASQLSPKQEKQAPQSLKNVLKSRIMLTRIFIFAFAWVANALGYYGLIFSSVAIGGNKQINFILTSLAELPAYGLTWIVLRKLGRREAQSGSFFLTAVSLYLFCFINKELHTLRLILYLLGKAAITMSFTIVYVYSSETFPTNVRHTLNGYCSTIGRLGSVVATQSALIALYVNPVVVYGSVAAISGILILFLPETRNTKLPDTLEEAEMIGQSIESPNEIKGSVQDDNESNRY